jgi:uncharacterized protein involved in outer membrane biogenesis
VLVRGGNYRIDVHARAGATRAHVYGGLRAPIDVSIFKLRATVSGENLADLYDQLGLALPETPPYSVSGNMIRDGNVFRYRDIRGTIGDSDIAGNVSLKLGRDRKFARGSLVSRHLDFDDLAGLIGAPPSTKPGESASPEQKAEASARAGEARVLPDRNYNVAKLRSMDADIKYRADAVDAGKMPIESFGAHLQLDHGLLKVKPLDIGIAGGALSGSIRLDARNDVISTTANLRARGIELPKLFPRTVPDSVGRIAGDLSLVGDGNSVASMLSTANGDVGAVMGPGRFSNLLLELAGLDVAESLKFLLDHDRTVPLRCAYADFDVTDGVMKTRAFAFDTTDTVVFGHGSADLGKEELNFELDPKPKDFSPVSLRVPLQIEGTFKHPSVRPESGPLATRAAVAGALFAIAPPAALLALIETGPGKDVDCGDSQPPLEKGKEGTKKPDHREAERPHWKDPAGSGKG